MSHIKDVYLTTRPAPRIAATAGLSAAVAARVAGILHERAAHGLATFRLAQVGNAMGPELRRLERLTGRRLIDIVRDDLGYDVRSPPDAPHAPFIALRKDARPPSRRSRVPEVLWRAFTTPLPAGRVRHFSIADGRHRDTPHADGARSSDPVIPTGLIYASPPKHLYDAVAASIQTWAADQQITLRHLDGVVADPAGPPSSRNIAETAT